MKLTLDDGTTFDIDAIATLEVRDGEILAIRSSSELDEQDMARIRQQAMRAFKCEVVVLPPELTLEVVSA